MSAPADHQEAPRFKWKDYFAELIAIREDTATCTTRLGPDRQRRIAILDRLTVLMQIGEDDVVKALRNAQAAFDDLKKK